MAVVKTRSAAGERGHGRQRSAGASAAALRVRVRQRGQGKGGGQHAIPAFDDTVTCLAGLPSPAQSSDRSYMPPARVSRWEFSAPVSGRDAPVVSVSGVPYTTTATPCYPARGPHRRTGEHTPGRASMRATKLEGLRGFR